MNISQRLIMFIYNSRRRFERHLRPLLLYRFWLQPLSPWMNTSLLFFFLPVKQVGDCPILERVGDSVEGGHWPYLSFSSHDSDPLILIRKKADWHEESPPVAWSQGTIRVCWYYRSRGNTWSHHSPKYFAENERKSAFFLIFFQYIFLNKKVHDSFAHRKVLSCHCYALGTFTKTVKLFYSDRI
jgi:hypothetical protein